MVNKKTTKNHTNRKAAKEHLRTLVENSNVSHVRSTGRIVKYGVMGFTRNIWLSIAATLVMTVTLVILMVTVFASLILTATAKTMQQKIDISIYFTPSTDIGTMNELANIMRTDENVDTVEVTDSAGEYDIFLRDRQDNEELLSALEDEAMHELMLNTMHPTMRVKVKDPNDLSSVKNLVETTEIFQEFIDPEESPTYDVNQAEISTINSWANVAKNGGLILGAVFLVISILVIFNTIRMAIFSRREEIHMMRLVGADGSFVRGPFLVEAQICGIISGILASTIAYAGFHFLAPKLANYGIDVSAITEVFESKMLVAVYAVMCGIGIIIGSISARLAMRKYLH